MNKSPLVSVVIPAYNASSFIRETLDSVLRQTYPNVEVIVVDDGSNDATPGIVKECAKKNHSVRYFFQKNQGQSAARKNGLEASRGEIVTFLDADNILLLDSCGTGAAALREGYDVCYSDIRYFETDRPNRLYKFSLHYVPEVTLERLIEHNFINFLGTFIRRDVLWDVFDERFRRADDHVIWLKLALRDARFHYIDKVFGHLRFHSRNLSFEKRYLLETAEMNLSLFRWLRDAAAKKYTPPRLSRILQKIDDQEKTWLKKGFLGSLIIRDKKEAMRWLMDWRAHGGGTISFCFFYLISSLAPLFLFSAVFPLLRRAIVMRKYRLIQDAAD